MEDLICLNQNESFIVCLRSLSCDQPGIANSIILLVHLKGKFLEENKICTNCRMMYLYQEANKKGNLTES